MANDQTLDQSDSVDRWVRTAARDRKSFGQLFDLFHPQIFAYCSRRLLVRAVAEDVASEVFLKVAKAISSFHGSTTEDFRRWLFRIATNEINAQLRKSIRQRTLLEAAATMGLVGKRISDQLLETESEVDWQQIYRAIGELSEREQSIVSLKFFGQQTHEEIGGVLDIKPATARVALNRALGKLRAKLQEPPRDGHLTPTNSNITSTTKREETL